MKELHNYVNAEICQKFVSWGKKAQKRILLFRLA